MSRNLLRITVTILAVLSFLICLLPVMSVYSGGLESCILFVRGYNLIEFSALGIIPLLSPVAVFLIIFVQQRKAAKELELIVLMFSNTVSYIHGFHAAHSWLESVGDSHVSYHSGLLLIPIIFIITVIFSITCDKARPVVYKLFTVKKEGI